MESEYDSTAGSKPEPTDWRVLFDERQLKQIAFSQSYAAHYAHGADGHNNMLIIAKMVKLLDEMALLAK